MWRMVLAQVLRRRGRSLAVVAAIVVAAVSFSLLSGSVATSQLQVQGTVEANFRTAYDILVRPARSQTGLERSDQLVQENYLSGIFGGITLEQYEQIKAMDDVEVAAPVAMVGYVLPQLFLDQLITEQVSKAQRQLFRVTRSWVSERELSSYPEADKYLYVTADPTTYDRTGVTQRDPVTGKTLRVCASFRQQVKKPRSAFDLARRVDLQCYSTNPPAPKGRSYLPFGEIGTDFIYPFPLLMAAIDPEQEAALVGLDDTVSDGRYLTSQDGPEIVPSFLHSKESIRYRRLPVLMADQPFVDERLRIQVQRLDLSDSRELPGRLGEPGAERWLNRLPGQTVQTRTLRPEQTYARLLDAYGVRAYLAKTQYWSTGQVDYQRTPSGHLLPTTREHPLPDTSVRTAGSGGLPGSTGERRHRVSRPTGPRRLPDDR